MRIHTSGLLDSLSRCCYASRMAKQKTSGPVRYHNLAGMMRDLRKALDNGDQEGYEFAELVAECDDLLGDDGGDSAEEDDGNCTTDGDTPEVDVSGAAVRAPFHARTGGPTPRSGDIGAPASILDRALDGLAGEERRQAQRELDQLRMHTMGASRPGNTRVAGLPRACK